MQADEAFEAAFGRIGDGQEREYAGIVDQNVGIETPAVDEADDLLGGVIACEVAEEGYGLDT